ncbi:MULTISPECIES: Gfo/Idh/MocA family protein [Helcococcus]|uniref:Gfo/Idh/MocA family oxidoreductase n=1 Tax=Helcococcus bovis TaxID=3153252 RepID=A0ABW9F8M7_9FIRM
MRFGIVGTNFITDEFMEGAMLLKDKIEITSICSGKIENAKKFAEKYNIKNVYENHIEMLESGKIDAIYIAVPNSLHFKMTMDAIQRNIPIFCEKPLAVNSKQVKILIDAAIKNKVYIHHGVVPLYTENFNIIKNNLQNIGKIRRAVFALNQYSSRYDRYLRGENPTTFRNEFANGAIMDLGIYIVSLCVALFGKPKTISANSFILDSKVDGATSAILSYENFEVILLCSKITNSNIISEISGEDGIISISIPSRVSTVKIQNRLDKVNIQTYHEMENSFKRELKEFLNVVENGKYESEILPYKLTSEIIDVMTQIRKISGVKFKEDN